MNKHEVTAKKVILANLLNTVLNQPVQQVKPEEINELTAFMVGWDMAILQTEFLLRDLELRAEITPVGIFMQMLHVPGFVPDANYHQVTTTLLQRAADREAQREAKTKTHIKCGNVYVPARNLA